MNGDPPPEQRLLAAEAELAVLRATVERLQDEVEAAEQRDARWRGLVERASADRELRAREAALAAVRAGLTRLASRLRPWRR